MNKKKEIKRNSMVHRSKWKVDWNKLWCWFDAVADERIIADYKKEIEDICLLSNWINGWLFSFMAQKMSED